MKAHYDEYRLTSLEWRRSGSPRQGNLVNSMRRLRLVFKPQLRLCRQNEENLNAQIAAEKLQSGNIQQFWKQIRNMIGERNKTSHSVDRIEGENEIG